VIAVGKIKTTSILQVEKEVAAYDEVSNFVISILSELAPQTDELLSRRHIASVALGRDVGSGLTHVIAKLQPQNSR
jgi:hypothetical protein